jgi:hypothetical protein
MVCTGTCQDMLNGQVASKGEQGSPCLVKRKDAFKTKRPSKLPRLRNFLKEHNSGRHFVCVCEHNLQVRRDMILSNTQFSSVPKKIYKERVPEFQKNKTRTALES